MNAVARPRILLVEDEVIVALMMEDVLADWGWEVAGSFGEVSATLDWLGDAAPVDAALLDINLGGEMVFPVAAALKDRGTPFVFLTGYTAPPGIEDFDAPLLNKPFDAPQLERALSRLLTQPEA